MNADDYNRGLDAALSVVNDLLASSKDHADVQNAINALRLPSELQQWLAELDANPVYHEPEQTEPGRCSVCGYDWPCPFDPKRPAPDEQPRG